MLYLKSGFKFWELDVGLVKVYRVMKAESALQSLECGVLPKKFIDFFDMRRE